MPSFYVDDRFPEHPKAIAAGDEACWLFICGLAYVRRNNVTTIPKPVAPRLVARGGPKLVKRLCDVNLWHDRGDHYEIHDYETRNAKQLQKSIQARSAAETRWKQVAERTRQDLQVSSASAYASALQPHSGRSASVMPVRVADPDIQISSSSSSPHPHRPPPDEPAEDEESSNRTITTKTMKILAERALANTTSTVGNPTAWLAKTAGQRLDQHRDTLKGLDLSGFDDPEELADILEPPRSTTLTETERYQAAQRAAETRADLPECSTCETRGGYGFVSIDNKSHPCPDCHPAAKVGVS